MAVIHGSPLTLPTILSYLILAGLCTGHCLDPRYLLSFCILAPRRPHMNLRVILQPIRLVEHAIALVRSSDRIFPISREPHCRDETVLGELIPKVDAFVRNVPEADAGVEAATQKETVVFWMEGDRCDNVGVLEAAKAFLARYMPQTYSLVHGGG